jgi:hypothetical protein
MTIGDIIEIDGRWCRVTDIIDETVYVVELGWFDKIQLRAQLAWEWFLNL